MRQQIYPVDVAPLLWGSCFPFPRRCGPPSGFRAVGRGRCHESYWRFSYRLYPISYVHPGDCADMVVSVVGAVVNPGRDAWQPSGDAILQLLEARGSRTQAQRDAMQWKFGFEAPPSTLRLEPEVIFDVARRCCSEQRPAPGGGAAAVLGGHLLLSSRPFQRRRRPAHPQGAPRLVCELQRGWRKIGSTMVLVSIQHVGKCIFYQFWS